MSKKKSWEDKFNLNTIPNQISTKLKWLVTPHGPTRILGTIAIAVFIGEMMVMFVLPMLPPLSLLTEAIIDSTLLIVVISPALYLFLFQPIILQIKAREQAEKKVRKNRDLLQVVFNGISDPLILMDEQLRVKMINTAASRYYKIDSQHAINQPCHKALMKSEKPCAECDIPKRMTGSGNLTFERKGLFDPSLIEEVVIYQSANPTNASGTSIVKISDVTAARASERHLRRNERLASLGLLISGVAHEINNPNNFISFNLPILQEYLEEIIPIIDDHAESRPDLEIANMPYNEFRKDLFKMMGNITHGSSRINAIVSRLKEFSRMQDSRKLSQVDINSVLEKVADLAQHQIKRMVKQFEFEVPSNLPPIYTDSQAIEQIVLNILINACQAADKPNAWVSLEAQLDPQPPYALCIEVTDNGCGIDDETLTHIFDPLFTSKGPDVGTGLGLYICHNLAEGLGGVIEVQSTLSQGSTFRLMLPDLKKSPLPTNAGRKVLAADKV